MSGVGKGFRLVLWALVVVLIVPIVLSVVAIFNGSFEMFPTAEQHAKIRIAASFIFLFFATIQAAILAVLIRTRR